jgi:hypothetical protein
MMAIMKSGKPTVLPMAYSFFRANSSELALLDVYVFTAACNAESHCRRRDLPGAAALDQRAKP